MAKKKSDVGAGLLVLVVGGLSLLALIPKEVWIGAALLTVLGAIAYFWSQSKKGSSSSSTPDQHPQRDSTLPSRRIRSQPPRATTFQSVARPVAPPSTVRPASHTSPASQQPRQADLPVSVARQEEPTSRGFLIPSAPQGFGPGRWVPAGETITVAGITIPGGMVYVGTSLPTPHGANDPCLIDPSKPVAKSGDYTERQMNYWPSYSEVSSAARRAYLNWLAGGRCDPEADVGFVFLFFYGLERRAILDASSDEAVEADWPAIEAELRRLLDIYGARSGSFRRYGGELLDWVATARYSLRLYEKPVPTFPKTFELPLYVRLALGQTAIDQVPVPPHLALAWARLNPGVALRTPAVRCAEEFDKLFVQKYSELCGPGITLPRNRTKLKLVYQPASSGFRGYNELKLTFNDTPDVSVLTGPIKKLQAVVDAATIPLESFSRQVGKSAEARSTLEAFLQLPATLWPSSAQATIQSLKGRMGEGMVAMTFQELLTALGGKSAFNKEKTASLARALESTGIGFEPDILGGAKTPKPDEKVVLFHLPASESISRANGPYLAAALTLQLASAVASADGEFGIKEMGHLRQTVLSWNHLTPSQTRRLLAHLRLLMQAPASLTALKKKFEPLDTTVKQTIGAFMATVAQSDGEVTPAEVKMLEKVYKALGIDAKRVFTDVHAVAVGQKATATQTKAVEETGFKLDPERIAALQKDTERVSALLANIFNDVDEVAASNPVGSKAQEPKDVSDQVLPQDPEEESSSEASDLLGLDEPHAALARLMLSRPEWTREELLDVAADLDLMLDGALERINEAAFDAHDMALFEGDDPVTVNAEILEKVAA